MSYYCHHKITKTIKLNTPTHLTASDHKTPEQTVKQSTICNTELVPSGDKFYWCMRHKDGCGLMWTKDVVEKLNRTSPDDPISFSFS